MVRRLLSIYVRRDTLPFVYRYSPKTSQKWERRKMARTVRDANLETRTARLRLPIRSEPYWRGLEKGFALGYRRRGKGGTWLARRRPAAGGYAEHKIGTSDDLRDADGVAFSTNGQAQKTAGMVANRTPPRGGSRHAVWPIHRRGRNEGGRYHEDEPEDAGKTVAVAQQDTSSASGELR